jgi:uncharacterized LabA/DUF88 family protein
LLWYDKAAQRFPPARQSHFQEIIAMTNSQKIVLFIDGYNFHATVRALGFEVDYKKLLQMFRERGRLLRATYYTTLFEEQGLRPLLDWLDYNGFTVVTKPAREYTDPDTGRRKVKGNMNIEIAIDALELAPHIGHMVLFSGDGDFCALVEAMQRRGIRVSVVSTTATQPPMIADELRRQADDFIELRALEDKISRTPREAGHDGQQLPAFVQRGNGDTAHD